MIIIKTDFSGFSVLEFLVISCVIFVIIGTFGIYSNKIIVGTREVALKYELAALRLRLKLHQILKETYPDTILEFYDVEDVRLDKEKNLLDPFGNIYIYSPKDGIVKSSTTGYEGW